MSRPPELAVSICVYRPDLDVLGKALRTLRAALEHAGRRSALTALVYIVDNSPEAGPGSQWCDAAAIQKPSGTKRHREWAEWIGC